MRSPFGETMSVTDEQITDAILRRIGDQADPDGHRVDAKRLRDGRHRLMHDGRLIGSMLVSNGRVSIALAARGQQITMPAIPGHELTEAEIDDAAALICEEAVPRTKP
jgi:hypothetical protein